MSEETRRNIKILFAEKRQEIGEISILRKELVSINAKDDSIISLEVKKSHFQIFGN